MVTARPRLRHSRVALPSKLAPLRIAILGYRSDSKVGGQGVYIDYLSQALSEAGAHVDVISGPPYPELSGDIRLLKIPSLDLYAQPHNGHYSLRPRHLLSKTDTCEYFGHLSGKFVEPYVFGERVYRFLKQRAHHYDVVLDNQTLASGMLRIQSGLGLPLVTMIHHPVTQDRRLALEAAETWRQRWSIKRWYAFHHMQIRVARRLKVMTCPSEAAKRDIVEAFGVDPDRLHPIPLGVDQSAFRPKPQIPRAKNRIISTASADTPLKGLPVLLKAYRQLLDNHPDLELVVIGKLRDGLARRMLGELGLEHCVQFKSGLTRRELAEEFCRATIAVTPSLYEGFGLPAAEAMSCGTPVIVTDGGALPEVAGDAGIVVPRGDADALAASIARLLDHADNRLSVGEACLMRARTEFDWRQIAPRYLSLMEEARANPC